MSSNEAPIADFARSIENFRGFERRLINAMEDDANGIVISPA